MKKFTSILAAIIISFLFSCNSSVPVPMKKAITQEEVVIHDLIGNEVYRGSKLPKDFSSFRDGVYFLGTKRIIVKDGEKFPKESSGTVVATTQ